MAETSHGVVKGRARERLAPRRRGPVRDLSAGISLAFSGVRTIVPGQEAFAMSLCRLETRSGFCREAGFTLTELMVGLVIFGIMTAVSLPGLNRFLRSVDLNGQVQATATSIRVARQRAITENNNYVVYWDSTIQGFGWYDDDNNNGVKDVTEKRKDPVAFPAWIIVTNSTTNPFASDITTFFPNGSASQSGSCLFTNSDGYVRSLSVVRPTGMVTVQ
jgi:prepilin-type N-terminal cleavage/methylation domain-containing protein